jgi:SET domain-containing protein
MGYGGIYSHSDDPNARWSIVEQSNGRETIDIRAIKDIKLGEEITVRYMSKNGNFWFEQVKE